MENLEKALQTAKPLSEKALKRTRLGFLLMAIGMIASAIASLGTKVTTYRCFDLRPGLPQWVIAIFCVIGLIALLASAILCIRLQPISLGLTFLPALYPIGSGLFRQDHFVAEYMAFSVWSFLLFFWAIRQMAPRFGRKAPICFGLWVAVFLGDLLASLTWNLNYHSRWCPQGFLIDYHNWADIRPGLVLLALGLAVITLFLMRASISKELENQQSKSL